MRIVHDESTCVGSDSQAAAKPSKGKAAASGVTDLAGAKFHVAQAEGEHNVYELITLDRMDEILDDDRTKHIVGDCREIIVNQLHARYPVARMEVSMIVPVENYSHTFWRAKTEDSHRIVEGWLVLDRPFIVEPTDVAQLKSICMDLGPTLIRDSDFEDLLGTVNAANEIGFTAVARAQIQALRLVQINYRPNFTRLKEHRQKKREIEKRIVNEFPNGILQSLYGALCPEKWPSGHPFKDIICSRDLYETRGWGNKRIRNFSVDDVLQMLALTRRLQPTAKGETPWWQQNDGKRYGAVYDFAAAVKEAMQFVHGVEAHARKAIAKDDDRARYNYDTHYVACADYAALKDLYLAGIKASDDGMPVPDDERIERIKKTWYIKEGEDAFYERSIANFAEMEEAFDLRRNWLGERHSDPNSHHEEPIPIGFDRETYVRKMRLCHSRKELQTLQLCRWLRKEARAAGIKIPPPPRIPKPPRKVKQKKTKPLKGSSAVNTVKDIISREDAA